MRSMRTRDDSQGFDEPVEVNRILSDLGLTGPFDQEQYIRTMEARFGSDGRRFMDAVDAASEGGYAAAAWRRLYQLKNRNWQMSAYVSAHQSSAAYRALLQWLVEHVGETPNKVLDLGCDVGTLTLALARLFPKAQVTGVDRIGLAISGAKKLRRALSISNVEFRCMDLTKEDTRDELMGFDLVVAGWVFHELLEGSVALDSRLPSAEERRASVRVPAHDGHDSGPMADTIPAAWRTVFRPDGGQFGGRSGTLSAMISERCPRSPARSR